MFNNPRRLFLVTILSFLLPVFMASAAPRIQFSAKLGDKGLVVRCGIPAGYYTYKSSPYASPLSISARAGRGISFGKPKMPAGISKGDETVYYGKVRVILPLISRGFCFFEKSVQGYSEGEVSAL